MTRASPRIRRDSMHTEERRAIMFVGFHVSVQIGSGITADRHPGVRAASNRAALTEYEQTKQHDGWTMDRYRAEVILSGPEHSPEHKEGRRHRGDTRQANQWADARASTSIDGDDTPHQQTRARDHASQTSDTSARHTIALQLNQRRAAPVAMQSAWHGAAAMN